MFKVGDSIKVVKPFLKTTGKVGKITRSGMSFFNQSIKVEVDIDGNLYTFNPMSLARFSPEAEVTYRVANSAQILKEVFNSYEDAVQAAKKWGASLKDGAELVILETVDTYRTTRSVQLEKV